jgi:hypothetical protein
LVAIDKCLTGTPDVGVKLLENVYEMVRESRMMYGVEIWGLKRDGKRLIKSMGECVKKKSWEFRDLLQMGWLY